MSDVFLSKSLIRSLFAHFLQITIDSLRKLMSKFPTLGFFVHFVFFFLIYFYCASFLFTLHPQVLFFLPLTMFLSSFLYFFQFITIQDLHCTVFITFALHFSFFLITQPVSFFLNFRIFYIIHSFCLFRCFFHFLELP